MTPTRGANRAAEHSIHPRTVAVPYSQEPWAPGVSRVPGLFPAPASRAV